MKEYRMKIEIKHKIWKRGEVRMKKEKTEETKKKRKKEI